jgi:hypothetical protein
MVRQVASVGGLGVLVLGCVFAASVPYKVMAQSCAGDCSGDGRVTIDEIVTCVGIALGTHAVSTCTDCDADGDGMVTVDEVIRAVGFALDACPAVTPEATPSPTPTTTPGECPTPASGSIIVLENLQVNDASDPVVQLTNTSRILAVASCFYADASPRCAGSGVPCTGNADCGGDTCEPTCGVAGFTVRLPMLSTLSWQPRLGGTDELGDPISAVPAMPFHGELVCVEVDIAGSALAGNHLAGATEQAPQCPVAATSIAGFVDTGNGDPVLCLDGELSDQCPSGAEYDGCPVGVDPIRVESCWSHSAFTFDCGPSVIVPTPTPTRTPPPDSTPTPTPCPPAARGSIVVFEELQVSAMDDPVVQLTNVSNALVHADCFYADTEAKCTITEFAVTLSKQSKATWQPRLGGMDTIGSSIPAVPALPFQGELVCVQVDDAGTPLSGDALSGAITSAGTCPGVATSIRGFPDIPGDNNVLCLGGATSAQCPNGAEYESCPTGLDPARIQGCWSQSRFTFLCG